MLSKRGDSISEQIKKHYETEPKEEEEVVKMLVPSGSTLLNCACSDSHRGAFSLGKMVNIIGDSFSGKTFLALSLLAECSHLKRYKQHHLIHDDAEEASEFSIKTLFGSRLAERIEPPAKEKDGEPKYSNTIQDFHFNIQKWLKKEVPFIYVLDSLDSITSEEEMKKVDIQMDQRAKGNKVVGSYGMDKPKIIAQILRMITRDLRKTDSLLIIISQTRDNLDPMSFQRKVRSGGRALKFYASHEIWLSLGKKVRAKDRVIGMITMIKITKNKLTGKMRDIEFPIYLNYGIDDLGSSVDWLVEQKYWRKKGNKIVAKGLKLVRQKGALIKEIEERGLEKELKQIVGKAWMEIEESLKLDRKARYV